MNWIEILWAVLGGIALLVALIRLGVAVGEALEDRRLTMQEIKGIIGKLLIIADALGNFRNRIKVLAPATSNLCFMKEHNAPHVAKPLMPPPPKKLGTITGSEIVTIFQQHGIRLAGGVVDREYELTSLKEMQPFLDWYYQTHPYTEDECDCDDAAWWMRADALGWMHCKFPWGYIEASGIDPDWNFPNHGFCFVFDEHKKLYFCDELRVAAPMDEFIEAYPVAANWWKV